MNKRMNWIAAITWMAASAWSPSALAHCDTLDGPVVATARQALESGNVNPVLAWVQPKDEAEIRDVFQKTLSVRKAGTEARDLADRYFFETLVRVHRLGEGASYTGLKAAGSTEPPVAAADRAIATGKPQELAALIGDRTEKGLHRHFEQVMAKKKFNPNDVQAGRAYSNAYVEFVHYAERLYDASETLAPDAPQKAPAAHTH